MTSTADSAHSAHPEQHVTPERTPLYGPEFAADPGRAYAELRRYGPIAPVELAPGVPAMLVLGYDAALEILRDPGTFPKDPRRWQQNIPPECPVLPMMMYRPNCLFTDGAVHARLRGAVTAGVDRIDTATLRESVERTADVLITQFAQAGTADLLGQYAKVLPLLVFNELFGCPPEIGDRFIYGINGIFDGVDAEHANAELTRAVTDLIALKRRNPGPDVTSWLLAHPAQLTDEEMAHQLVVFIGAGNEPMVNLIANALRLLLSDDRFAGDLSGGSLPIEDALDEVLWTDPPMANYAITYPDHDVDFGGIRLPADQPVVISFAATNTDPAKGSDHRTGNRAHLAWSAGPHTCPAKGHARLIATVAIEKLLDRLPDIELAIPADDLQWRPGPFHRALVALPARFPPLPVAALSTTPAQVPSPGYIAPPLGQPAPSTGPATPPPGQAAPSTGHATSSAPAQTPTEQTHSPRSRGLLGLLRAWLRGE